MKYSNCWCFLFALLALSACRKVTTFDLNEATFDLQNVRLGISFPAVSDASQRAFTLPLLKELNVTDIRFGEEWRFREPSPGQFNWSPLDDRINWANSNGFKVMLTINSNGPDWACSGDQNEKSCIFNDNQDFQNYIELLLQRYPNQIDRIQFGNEWQSDFWYVGTAEEFTAVNNIVYDAIQTYSPGTQHVLGGFTAISLRFLAGCNGMVDSFFDDEGIEYDRAFLDLNCNSSAFLDVVERIDYVLDSARYDLADIHLYDDTENWEAYYLNFLAKVSKPVIVSEFGGPNLNLESADEDYQAERLFDYIQAIDQMGVSSAYFFRLIEGSDNPAHRKSGLIRVADLGKKKSFEVFRRFTE